MFGTATIFGLVAVAIQMGNSKMLVLLSGLMVRYHCISRKKNWRQFHIRFVNVVLEVVRSFTCPSEILGNRMS